MADPTRSLPLLSILWLLLSAFLISPSSPLQLPGLTHSATEQSVARPAGNQNYNAINLVRRPPLRYGSPAALRNNSSPALRALRNDSSPALHALRNDSTAAPQADHNAISPDRLQSSRLHPPNSNGSHCGACHIAVYGARLHYFSDSPPGNVSSSSDNSSHISNSTYRASKGLGSRNNILFPELGLHQKLPGRYDRVATVDDFVMTSPTIYVELLQPATLKDACFILGEVAPNNFFAVTSTMSGEYSLGEEYIDQSPKPEVLTSAGAGLSLERAPTKVATPQQIQISDLATPTSGFGVSTLTKMLASSYKADTMTATITTFGPPWLPIISTPPLWDLFGLFFEPGCNDRLDPPTMRPFALLEPPVAHIGTEKVRPAGDSWPQRPPPKVPMARLRADGLVAESKEEVVVVATSTSEPRPYPTRTPPPDLPGGVKPVRGGKAAKDPLVHQQPTPEARISRPRATALVDPPAPSKTHPQSLAQLPNQVNPNPEEHTDGSESTEHPKNAGNAFANKEPKATVGSTKPVEVAPNASSGTDGRTPGQAFADTFFRGNPFKPKPAKPSQPEQRTGDDGVRTAATSVPGQTDERYHEPGRGDTSPTHTETDDSSDHKANASSESSRPDQNAGNNEARTTVASSPGHTDKGTHEPGRVDTSPKDAEAGGSSDHNANATSESPQPPQKSSQDEGHAIGGSDTGPVEQGKHRPEQSDHNTNGPNTGNPSDRDANVPVNPVINPSILTDPPKPTLQPMVNPGDRQYYPIVTAAPARGSEKAALNPHHDSPQGSTGAAAEGAGVLVSVESGSILDIEASKINLAAPSASQAPLKIGNKVVSPDPQGVNVNEQIIHPGEPGIEIPDPEGSVTEKSVGAAPQDAGVVISLGSSGILDIGASKIDLAVPTALRTPLTVGNQVFAPDPQGFKVNGQSIGPGGPAITIPSPERSIAPKQPAVIVPAFLTAAVGSNTLFPTGLAIAGNTIRPGGPEVTISGTGVALDKPGHLLVGGTAMENTTSPDDLGKQQVPADAPGIAIAGKTITPGGPEVTVSGAKISLGQSGVLRIGSLTTALPSPQKSDEPLGITFAGNGGTAEVFRVTPVPVAGPADKQQAPGDGPGIQIAGQTLNPGSPQVTVSGKAVSLGRSGVLRIGSVTTTLLSPQQSNIPLAFTLAGDDGTAEVLSVTPVPMAEPTAAPGVAVGGKTLTPGGPQVTVSGQAISLGESGYLRIGSFTRTLGAESSAGPLRFTFIGEDGTAGVLGVTPISLARPTVVPGIAIAGKTLTPGGAQITVSGEGISLGESGILRIGSLTRTLHPEKSNGPLAITLPGDDGNDEVLNVTPVSVAAPTNGAGIAIAGNTLTPGGAQVTVSGEAISLGESGILRIGSVTTTLGPQMSEEPLGFTFAGDGGTAGVLSVTPISVAAPTDRDNKSSDVGASEGSADRSSGKASLSCVFLVFVNIIMCI